MGIHCSAGASPISPKIKDHDLPPIVGKFHLFPINIFSNDLRGNFSDGKFLGGVAFGLDRIGNVAAIDFKVRMVGEELFGKGGMFVCFLFDVFDSSHESVDRTAPEILDLASRVTVREDPAMSAQLPERRPASVAVTLSDGRTLTARTDTNRGDWADPYSPSDIRSKYLSLTTRLWRESAAADVWDEVMMLETRPDISNLEKLMRAAV